MWQLVGRAQRPNFFLVNSPWVGVTVDDSKQFWADSSSNSDANSDEPESCDFAESAESQRAYQKKNKLPDID